MTAEKVRVLVVDDSPEDVALVRRLLGRYDGASFQVTARASTGDGVEELRGNGADVMLLDYAMPEEDGIAFLQRAGGERVLPPVIMLTGRGDERLAVDAMRSGAFDYLAKDSIRTDLLGDAVCRAIQTFRREEEGRHFDEQIMFALASAAEGRDFTTGQHLQRLARYAMLVGDALGLGEGELRVLRCGGLLHDVGKLAVSPATLRRPGPLSPDEWEEVRQHPIVGERICRCLALGRQVAPIIRHHHERWDGGGYVDGLAGERIPFFARIIAVVDAFDAMSSDRPYRRALPARRVVQELHDGAGSQWDPAIVAALLELVDAGAVDPGAAASRPRRRARGQAR